MTRVNLLKMALPTVIGIAFVIWMGWDLVATESPLATFNEIGETTNFDRPILLRRTSPNGHLLVKILNEDIVYHWDLNRMQGERVDRSIWDRSQEKITICGGGRQLGRDRESAFNTYGNYLLSTNTSPSEQLVAAVSAYGPKGPAMGGLIFGGGGGRIFGTRYLELKENRPGYPTVGRPIRISAYDEPYVCWSNDERFVVLFDEVYRFSVLDRTKEAVSEVTFYEEDLDKVEAKPDLSGLTGAFSDYGVDEDGNGLFEKVAFQVQTHTTFAGPYTISVTLRSADGKLEAGVLEADLAEGVQSSILTLDVEDWFDERTTNQFKVEHIVLRLGDMDVDSRDNAGSTATYELRQFELISTGEQDKTERKPRRRM